MKQLLKGKISISRFSGGPKRSGITITLVDELSGTECCSIEVDAATFGNAVTGLSYLDCEYEWRPDKVGKKLENKSVIVPFNYVNYDKREEEARAALKPHETDGWLGSVTDMCNHHNRTEKGQRVNFRRYVDPYELLRL